MALSRKSLEKLSDVRRAWRVFPNIEIVGYYEFFTQSIHTPSLESRDVVDLKTPDFLLKHKAYSLFAHELTHWLDHSSTVWGRDNLIRLYNAIHVRLSNNADDYWKIPAVTTELRRIHYADYYTTLGPAAADASLPWVAELTCGMQFGPDGRLRPERPIVFTNFKDLQGRRIVRVPFSVASLLETRAVQSELECDLRHLDQLGQDEKMVQSRLWRDNLDRQLYAADLGVYSVSAHTVSNRLKVSDVRTVYGYSSALSSLCLNLPVRLFPQIQVPEGFGAWGEKVAHLLRLGDRGFAFLVLARNAPAAAMGSIPEWLDKALVNSGLPDLKSLEPMIEEEIATPQEPIVDGPLSMRLRSLLNVGARNFHRRGVLGDNDAVVAAVLKEQSELELPPIILGDGELFQLGKSLSQDVFGDVEQWLFRAWDLNKEFNDFMAVCLP